MSWWFVQLFFIGMSIFKLVFSLPFKPCLNSFSFFFFLILTYTRILCITILTDNNKGSFHFRVLSDFPPPMNQMVRYSR